MFDCAEISNGITIYKLKQILDSGENDMFDEKIDREKLSRYLNELEDEQKILQQKNCAEKSSCKISDKCGIPQIEADVECEKTQVKSKQSLEDILSGKDEPCSKPERKVNLSQTLSDIDTDSLFESIINLKYKK